MSAFDVDDAGEIRPVADIVATYLRCGLETISMKNIQVIDGAMNTAYAIFAATDEEFCLIFPEEGQDIEFIEDVVARLGDLQVGQLMAPVWNRSIPKPQVIGIHGTLFYGLDYKKKYYENKKESVIDWKLVD